MAHQVAFGSYIAKESFVHNAKTQIKIILVCVFSVCVLFVDTWTGLGALALLVLVSYLAAHLPLKRALGGLAPIGFILLCTVIAHAFCANVFETQTQVGGVGLDAKYAIWGTFGITADGLLAGLFFAARIGLVGMACSLLTFTSDNSRILGAIDALIAPLQKIQVPVRDVSTVVAMSLRFVPTITSEIYSVRDAQLARGLNLDSGAMSARVHGWSTVFIPVVVRLFLKANKLARAMDARCYDSGALSCRKGEALTAKEWLFVAGAIAIMVLVDVLA